MQASGRMGMQSTSGSSTHLHEQLLLPLLGLLRQEAALLRLLLQQCSSLHARRGFSGLKPTSQGGVHEPCIDAHVSAA